MFNSKTTSESLQKKSSDILSIFTKTISDLKDVNVKATNQAAANRDEAQKLIAEANSLSAVASDNAKVIEKIEAILA